MKTEATPSNAKETQSQGLSELQGSFCFLNGVSAPVQTAQRLISVVILGSVQVTYSPYFTLQVTYLQ